jgi:hypothetical protein
MECRKDGAWRWASLWNHVAGTHLHQTQLLDLAQAPLGGSAARV